MDDDVRRLRRGLLAGVMGDHLDWLTDRVISALLAQVPEYRDLDPVDLRRLAHLQIASVQRYFTGETERALREGPSAYGEQRAAEGIPLDAVFHAYRVAWAELWTAVTERALAEGTATPSDLVQASGEFFWMADLFASTAGRAYRVIAEEKLLLRERERAATAEALLLGQVPAGHPTKEASRVLGLPVDGRFVVVSGRATEEGRTALPGIQSELSRRGLGSAWRLTRQREAGIVHLPEASSLDTLLAVLARHATRLGVSPVVTGLGAVSSALPLASLAEQMVTGPGIRQFSPSPLARVLAAAPDESNILVHSVLGGVLELPDAEADPLLSTLRVWFDVAGATGEAATRLFCHPNTIRYRLRRVEQLTERSLHDPNQAAELWSALLAHDQIPLADSHE